MARIHRALALALASALSLLPALARADDPYADFRVPEHRTFSWILASNGGIQSTRQDERGAFRDRLANGHALSQMAWASETEARQLDLFLVADARWNDNHHRFDRQLPPAGFDHASARDRADAQSLTWLGDQRTYLGGSSFAVESQGSAALDFAQQGRSDAEHFFFTSPSLSTFEQFSGDDIESRLYRQAGFLSLGAHRRSPGWGTNGPTPAGRGLWLNRKGAPRSISLSRADPMPNTTSSLLHRSARSSSSPATTSSPGELLERAE